MALSGKDTGGSQFFVTHSPAAPPRRRLHALRLGGRGHGRRGQDPSRGRHRAGGDLDGPVRPGYRLLALDIDGTLLRSDKTVSPRTLRALDAARRAGVRLVLVTGPALSGRARVAARAPGLRRGPGAPQRRPRSWRARRWCAAGPWTCEVARLGRAAWAARRARIRGALRPRRRGACSSCRAAWRLEHAARLLPRPFPSRRAHGRGPRARRSARTRAGHVRRRPARRWRSLRRAWPESLEGAPASSARSIRDWASRSSTSWTPGVGKAEALAFLQARCGIAAAETLAIGDNWNDHEMLARRGAGAGDGQRRPRDAGPGPARAPHQRRGRRGARHRSTTCSSARTRTTKAVPI